MKFTNKDIFEKSLIKGVLTAQLMKVRKNVNRADA